MKYIKSSNIIISIISTILAIAVSACSNNFLDVEPQAQKPVKGFWITEDDATDAVNAIYGDLRMAGQVDIASFAVESLGSDDADPGAKKNDIPAMYQFDNFSVTPSNPELQTFWSSVYQEIDLCNQVLDNVDTMSTVQGNLKERYLAEAKFVRAYCYFRLVRAFGGVPLHLRVPTTPEEFNLPRATAADVWDAIEKDLTDATQALPVTYSSPDDIGRATKGAAEALHAKVAMYQAKDNPSEWKEVKSYTDDIINSGIYRLFPDYNAMFTIPNENNSGSIFEIQCGLFPAAGQGEPFPWSQWAEGQIPENRYGWGWNVPSEDLVNAFKAAGDIVRMKATIITLPGTVRGDYIVQAGNNNPRYNKKAYVSSSYYVPGYPIGCKKDIYVLRYDEVLLMNAEANDELGDIGAAEKSLNLVRARVNLPPVTTTDQKELLKAIWLERRLELAMENDRYFDVIRQGRASELFGKKGWTTKNKVWPIPYNEILRSGGVLTQNPGY